MLAWKTALKITVDSAITALVPNGLNYRSPKTVATLPAVTYFIVSDVSGLETGPQDIRFQIDIFDDDDIRAEAIREAIRTALHDIPFVVSGATHDFLKEVSKIEFPMDADLECFHWVVEYRSILYRD